MKVNKHTNCTAILIAKAKFPVLASAYDDWRLYLFIFIYFFLFSPSVFRFLHMSRNSTNEEKRKNKANQTEAKRRKKWDKKRHCFHASTINCISMPTYTHSVHGVMFNFQFILIVNCFVCAVSFRFDCC